MGVIMGKKKKKVLQCFLSWKFYFSLQKSRKTSKAQGGHQMIL